MKKRILSIVLSIVMLVSLLPTTALAQATYGHPGHSCGDCSHIENDPHKTVLSSKWTEWDDGTSLPTNAGNYYLTTDITLSEGHTFFSEVTICLNGHSITVGSGGNILVGIPAGKNLTITDCSDSDSGKIT